MSKKEEKGETDMKEDKSLKMRSVVYCSVWICNVDRILHFDVSKE